MLRSIIGGRVKHHVSAPALDDGPQHLEDALQAIGHVINGDVEKAEADLSGGSSPFHEFGRAVVLFMRATLGLEQEVLREVFDKLAETDSLASSHQRSAQKNSRYSHSTIFPAGTEYALCIAETQLMGAVAAVLSESLSESMKGFVKLRKAFLTLESILMSEKKFLNSPEKRLLAPSSATNSGRTSMESGNSSPSGRVSATDARSPTASPLTTASPRMEDLTASPEASDDDEFFDASEEAQDVLDEYLGHLELSDHEGEDDVATGTAQDSSQSSGANAPSFKSQPPPRPGLLEAARRLSYIEGEELLHADALQNNPVDIFIHSGVCLCFGLLLLMFAQIPPAYAPLLKIVGFRGDRARGISLLWQASKFNNIHGAFAGMVLLTYYNNVVGFADIVPPPALGGIPKERCKTLLHDMRHRYPRSELWRLLDAQMEATEKNMEKTLKLTEAKGPPEQREAEALRVFNRSLLFIFLHRYQDCADSFIEVTKLNKWSLGVYYYIAATAQIELYREFKTSDPVKASQHAAKANEYFTEVPKHSGRKRFMSRQLPFDQFISRKHWEQRAQEWHVSFIDAIGVSPFEEMVYFWNGYPKMRAEHLEESLRRLSWATSTENPHWDKEGPDERTVLAVLRAATLRHLGRTAEAKETLQRDVLCYDPAELRGGLKENWTSPCAHYEMAVNLWRERDGTEKDAERVRECSRLMDDIANWSRFNLDARIGIKVTIAQTVLQKHNE